MLAKQSTSGVLPDRRERSNSARLLVFSGIMLVVGIALWAAGARTPYASPILSSAMTPDYVDRSLQDAALAALGNRRGSVIIMDPQTGRVRAVVNQTLAYEQNFRPGSTIKPFTTLTALRTGLINEESHTLCHEKYFHEDFHTTCSHPRDLPPFNPTEAIAYSCNYFFGTVGERLAEPNFTSTLSEFGFGRKTGVNAEESQGKLLRVAWHSQNAIGEGDNIQATPLQVLNAYSALVNGGHLFTPRAAPDSGFVPEVRANITIEDEHRTLILKGMRGVVRYGTAETAHLHTLPVYIFGKTGTATEIDGFRTQGWFVGFASRLREGAGEVAEMAPNRVELAVLVFLSRAHGFDAAEVARPIFEEYARAISDRDPGSEVPAGEWKKSYSAPDSVPVSGSMVRLHQVRENATSSMTLEDYVLGVVAAEGSTESEPEALKALAIASRTYAVKNMGRHEQDGYDFCTSTHCQRFRAVGFESPSYISQGIIEAANATRGLVLREANNRLADSYFSASCGGATANISTLWSGSAPPHLRGVDDEYCTTGPHHRWTDVITSAQLLKALQADPRTNVGSRLRHIEVSRRDRSGRAESITLEGDRRLTVKGWDFKIVVGRALGWNLLKSSRFEVSHAGANFVFRGTGFGHGLGLCQEGAHVMAEHGKSYRGILEKYFPSTRVSSVTPADRVMTSLDLIWNDKRLLETASTGRLLRPAGNRQILSSENFRINYPGTISQREAAMLLRFLQSSRNSLIARIAAAGFTTQLPPLEIFINETTGDFVGRTGQPAWAAAATKGHRIDLQPLATLKRRQVLETTLRHELVHTLIETLGRGRTPRWLAEGLAIHYAGEGRLVAKHQPRSKLTTQEIERMLGQSSSAADLRAAYAAAYAEVKQLIGKEGEAGVWRRVAG